MKSISYILVLLFLSFTSAQEKTYTETEIEISELVDGSLIIPETGNKIDLVIIIAGSGPTNRNGNQNFLKSNNLKKLAESLAENDIASFRYDKRI